MRLGIIADDLTGASDIGLVFSRRGFRTTLYPGVPGSAAEAALEVGIVALKSRTQPVHEAVSDSLLALDWLRIQGAGQIVFKYCSTFDSTPEGNIGPVATALAEALDARTVVVCPAYPTLGRTVFQGHLFVGDRLLNESGMERHPLTPMTDADIRRWLAQQTDWPVGHIPAGTVLEGRAAIGGALDQIKGQSFVVVDTIRDEDLIEIGVAASQAPLVTGGSGIALGLLDQPAGGCVPFKGNSGRALAVAGSCSATTRAQIAHHSKAAPILPVTADDLACGAMTAAQAFAWADRQGDDAPLVYSSAKPAEVAKAQNKYGMEESAALFEAFFASLVRLAAEAGYGRLISAGGETSGAVVAALAPNGLELGPEIAPGVPAMRDPSSGLCLALKSGNFGSAGFFAHAAGIMASA